MGYMKKSDIPACNILWKGERKKQVGTYKYMGFTITPDVGCDTYIKKRIALFKDTFIKMISIFVDFHLQRQKFQNLHQNQDCESLQ